MPVRTSVAAVSVTAVDDDITLQRRAARRFSLIAGCSWLGVALLGIASATLLANSFKGGAMTLLSVAALASVPVLFWVGRLSLLRDEHARLAFDVGSAFSPLLFVAVFQQYLDAVLAEASLTFAASVYLQTRDAFGPLSSLSPWLVGGGVLCGLQLARWRYARQRMWLSHVIAAIVAAATSYGVWASSVVVPR